ncbi:MAG TPA: hypothetical protein VHS99_03310, partial [Chloroflexota bacterium]|nr:hypothetical protein [Chloroflexota bacterium]
MSGRPGGGAGAGRDRGGPRGGATAPLPLPTEERATLDTLLSATTSVTPLGDLSPDGKTAVVHSVAPPADHSEEQAPSPLQFLEIETGELTPFPPDVLADPLVDLNLYRWGRDWAALRWLDDHTLQYLRASVATPQEGEPGSPGQAGQAGQAGAPRLAWSLVTVDRRSGEVRAAPLPVQGMVLGTTPDFSRLVDVVPLAAPAPEAVEAAGPLAALTTVDRVASLVASASGERLEGARIPAGFDVEPPSWTRDGLKAVVTTGAAARRFIGRTPFSPATDHPLVQDALGRPPPAENPIPRHNLLRVYDFTRPDPLRLQLDAAADDLFAAAAMSPDGTRFPVRRTPPSLLAGRPHPTYGYPDRSYFEVYSLDGERLDVIERPELANPRVVRARFVSERRVLFTSAVGLDIGLFVYDLPARELRRLPLPHGSVTLPGRPAVDAAGGTAVFGFSSFVQPPELFRVPLDGSASPARLTAINAALEGVDRV